MNFSRPADNAQIDLYAHKKMRRTRLVIRNNRNRRRFLPNLQVVSLLSEKLGKVFKLKVCSKTLRSIEHNGGLDAYLESTSNTKLTPEAQKIKKQIDLPVG